MLNSISDYVYTRADYEGLVNVSGRIIPSEDVSGQRNAIRTENFAFLCEAISERLGYRRLAYKPHSLDRTLLQGLGGAVRQLYQQGGFVDASVEFPRRIAANSGASAADVYVSAKLTERDCTVPTRAARSLDANYLRHCFYDVERLRTKFVDYDSAAVVRTTAGAVRLSAVEVRYTGGTLEEKTVTDEFVAGGGLLPLGDADGTGHRFAMTWTSGSWYLLMGDLYEFSNIAFRSDGKRTNTFELHYNGGWICVCSTSHHAEISPLKLFVLYSIEHVHASYVGAKDSTSEVKYVYSPVNVARATDSDGFAEYLYFNVGLRLASYRDLVTFAFPGAALDLSSPGNDDYRITYVGANLLASANYRSEISSLGWTWKP